MYATLIIENDRRTWGDSENDITRGCAVVSDKNIVNARAGGSTGCFDVERIRARDLEHICAVGVEFDVWAVLSIHKPTVWRRCRHHRDYNEHVDSQREEENEMDNEVRRRDLLVSISVV